MRLCEYAGVRFLTLADVAETLNISSAQAYALVRSGDLRAIKVGGRGQWRVETTELEAYIERAYAQTAAMLGDLDPAEINADVVRLDGDVGPVNRVVLPTYEEGAEATLQRLEPHEAVVELLANTLNLARAGQAALDAVCDLATTVPVERLVHGNAHRAVARVSTQLV